MIPVLNSEQIKAVDTYTIANEPIASIDLMERAVDRLLPHFLYLKNKNIHIICGTGNNGGDGIVLALKLWHSMVHCHVTIADFGNRHSSDFSENLLRLQRKTEVPVLIAYNISEIKIEDGELIVDALFGNGLKSVLEGSYLELISLLNQSQAEIISIDMPSGLMSEGETPEDKYVHAAKTYVIQLPRPSILIPEHRIDFEIVDIGLDKEFIGKQKTNSYLIEESDAELNPRNRFAYKNSFGHLLVVGGSKGMYGAPVISTKAAFKFGVGLVTCLVPENGSEVIHNNILEAMVQNAGSDFLEGKLPDLSKYDALIIGMGMGQEYSSFGFLKEIISNAKGSILLDADALNLIAQHHAIDIIKPGSILTPHIGEFKRLVGNWKTESEKLQKLRLLSEQTQSIVVLKGTYTAIAEPGGDIFYNTTGNVSLATAGAGDMLSGVTGSFLAQGYTPLEAAIRGVYYHGKSAENFMGSPVRITEIIESIRF